MAQWSTSQLSVGEVKGSILGEVIEYQNYPHEQLGSHLATRIAGIPNVSKLSPLKAIDKEIGCSIFVLCLPFFN